MMPIPNPSNKGAELHNTFSVYPISGNKCGSGETSYMDGSANLFLFHRDRFNQFMDWAPTIPGGPLINSGGV